MSKLRSINDNVLVEAIVAGKTALEAGKLAGYNTDRVKEKSIKEMVSRKINQNQNIKRTLIQKLEEKQNKILDSIRQEEIESAGLSQKAVAFGIFDAATAGNLLYWADLTVSKTVGSGDTAEFAVGDIDITED